MSTIPAHMMPGDLSALKLDRKAVRKVRREAKKARAFGVMRGLAAGLRPGDKVLMNFPAACHDPEQFENPDEFIIDRAQNRHIAFGHGAHICLGQHLARMEMRALWEELLPRLEHVELNGDPQRMVANFVCGPKSVPIKFKMA